jgi:RNA polymerase sigma factor (sigma-70 family)
VRRHESPVRAFLARAGGREGADDIAQETFLKAWRLAASWRGEGSYRGWLLRIAWTTMISAKRRERPASDAIDAVHHDASDARIDSERALARLSPNERGAALLCFGHGHSHAEAAEIMGLPLGTLKSLVGRARSKLTDYLGDRP